MKHVVILGAGTGGTIVANRLARALPADWDLRVVDQDPLHLYQPGLLFVPFGGHRVHQLQRLKAHTLPARAAFTLAAVDRVEPDHRRVLLADGSEVAYDVLVIATGCRIAPEELEGLTGAGWRRDAFDFYTPAGASALHERLRTFDRGRLVIHVKEMPIKCPVAPLEFAFLADDYFRRRGIRDHVEITYVTPLPGAFTKPVCSQVLGGMLDERGIRLEREFDAERVDGATREIIGYDGRRVPYDLLVSIPTNMGDPLVHRSGIGDELDFVPVDPPTLQARIAPDIFALGDAAAFPGSKAGSVAHFQAEVVAANVLRTIGALPPEPASDGHTNCFIETGRGRAIMIDFNYDHQPLPGRFPLPGVGPFSLLRETRINHWGKLAFRWAYWNVLLPGRTLPFVTNRFTTAGKDLAAFGGQEVIHGPTPGH